MDRIAPPLCPPRLRPFSGRVQGERGGGNACWRPSSPLPPLTGYLGSFTELAPPPRPLMSFHSALLLARPIWLWFSACARGAVGRPPQRGGSSPWLPWCGAVQPSPFPRPDGRLCPAEPLPPVGGVPGPPRSSGLRLFGRGERPSALPMPREKAGAGAGCGRHRAVVAERADAGRRPGAPPLWRLVSLSPAPPRSKPLGERAVCTSLKGRETGLAPQGASEFFVALHALPPVNWRSRIPLRVIFTPSAPLLSGGFLRKQVAFPGKTGGAGVTKKKAPASRRGLFLHVGQPRTATASISTRPPLGRAATATQERAGKAPSKYLA